MHSIRKKKGYIPAADRVRSSAAKPPSTWWDVLFTFNSATCLSLLGVIIALHACVDSSSLAKADRRAELLVDTYSLQDDIRALEVELDQYERQVKSALNSPSPLVANLRQLILQKVDDSNHRIRPSLQRQMRELEEIADDLEEGRQWWLDGVMASKLRTTWIEVSRQHRRMRADFESSRMVLEYSEGTAEEDQKWASEREERRNENSWWQKLMNEDELLVRKSTY